MTKKISLFILLCLAPILQRCNENNKELEHIENVRNTYLIDLDEFEEQTEGLRDQVKRNISPALIKRAFLICREKFKAIEFIAEYYFPGTAKSINGPPIDEVEEDDPLKMSVPAEGLQVIEEFIFPEYSVVNKEKALTEIGKLLSSVHRLKKISENTAFTKPQIFEAVKLEIVRIVSLGISGFDSPIAQNSLNEAKISLQAIQKHLALLCEHKGIHELNNLNISIDHARSYLSKGDFNSFDRMEFIKNYMTPLYQEIYHYQLKLNIAFGNSSKAILLNNPNLFAPTNFNLNFFAPDASSYNSPDKIHLGRILFYDPVISGNGQRSCASCHNPSKAFSDGKSKSLAFNFKGEVKRNAPTIINAGLQSALFHDGRVMYLEDQATEVINNPLEMHSSMKIAAGKLEKSEHYVDLFKKAFPGSRNPVSDKNIKIALASFTRSLSSLNSRFDKYLREENKSLTNSEINGFNLFMGKAKCGTCHFMPLFNGLVPPAFEVSEAEVIGVPTVNDSTKIDPDLGKYLVFSAEKNKHAFKTPTLRNIELTGPYMHNGVFKSLEEVVEFYNKGGGKGLGIDLPNQTLPETKLNLSTKEKKDLVAFMNTLTDTTGMTAIPQNLPLFQDPNLNRRIIGGIY
jgi:cytochrome c peroxidase